MTVDNDVFFLVISIRKGIFFFVRRFGNMKNYGHV